MTNCQNKFSDECFAKLEEFIERIEDKNGSLITVLHKAQEIFGYLPANVQEFVASKLNLPLSKVYGVVSFYSYFTMVPRGKHPISVCMGTACYVKGAEKILNEFKRELDVEIGECTPDGKFSIDALRCIGACGLAPVVMIGEKVYGNLKSSQVSEIIEEYK